MPGWIKSIAEHLWATHLRFLALYTMTTEMYGLHVITSNRIQRLPSRYTASQIPNVHSNSSTYLYFKKKFGGSKSLSHVALPNMISSVMAKPCLNSSCMMVWVDIDTLNVEFCCGYAGVIMGIRWSRSEMFTWNFKW